jgi:mono/diheme cytochrome c family protein
MSETIEATVAMLAAVLLAWSGAWAWRRKNLLLKWAGAGVAALLSLAAVTISVLIVLALDRLGSRSAPPVELQLAGTADQVHRGHEIVVGFCSGCHAAPDGLTGGSDLGKDLPLPIGSFVASNLTPAGRLSQWSDSDIFRAIRNGVAPDGSWLLIMSFTNAGKLSDEDTLAVIAYLRTLPARGTDTGTSPDRLSLLGLLMLGADLLPDGKPIVRGVVAAPPRAPTAQFGNYILSYQDCRECHGKDLTGGVPGQLAPLGPDLGVVKGWTYEEFVATMRTGTDPSGHRLGDVMPWQTAGRMQDDELRAVYDYLVQLPALQ